MSRTAVVILNYNGEKLLQKFLPSVLQHSGDALVIVADNGSTDASAKILSEKFPSVKLLQLDSNYGFCGGYNLALKQVDADYYVLLNSDVEVTPDWLKPLSAMLDDDPTIGAVQPKILSYSQKNYFEYAGAGGGFIDALGYPFCRGRIFSTVEEDHGQYDDTCPVFWATGACLMIRSSLYHRFEGLDEDFFAHMEEIDLCWKIQRAGFRIFYNGSIKVFHLGAGTLGYASPKKTYLNFRNNLFLIYKHFSPVELFFKLPLRFLLDWSALLMFLAKGEATHAKAVLAAHMDFLKAHRSIRLKRKAIQRKYPSYPRNTIYPGVVLLNYFLFGRKKFEWRQ